MTQFRGIFFYRQYYCKFIFWRDAVLRKESLIVFFKRVLNLRFLMSSAAGEYITTVEPNPATSYRVVEVQINEHALIMRTLCVRTPK